MTGTINVSTVASEVRRIIRVDRAAPGSSTPHMRLTVVMDALRDLETKLPSRDVEAFETPNVASFGYATVLGWLAEQDPLTLASLADPVRDTIEVGLKATALCHKRGLKVVKVAACDHVKQRYAKVATVNAYPSDVLAEVLAEWVPPTDRRPDVVLFTSPSLDPVQLGA